jgi:hypothetical protein
MIISGNSSVLEIEHASLIQEMSTYKNIKSFSCHEYLQGIIALNELHLKLKAVI